MDASLRLRAAAVAAYAISLVVIAALAPATRSLWGTPGFLNAMRGVLAGAAAIALVLAARRMRTLPVRRLLGLLVVAGLTLLALRYAPNTIDPASRLREQTHLAQYGLLAVAAACAFRRRFTDGSLYVVALTVVLATGFVDESVQWWVPGRVGALEDIRLDLVSGLLGVTLTALVIFPKEVGLGIREDGVVTSLRAAALVVLLFCGFVHLVHLGHRIAIPSAGVVARSQYTRDGLSRVAATWVRREREPGPFEGLLRGKDYFVIEGHYHRVTRDQNLAAQDFVRAAQEQAVLETLYAPYLAGTPEFALAPDVEQRLRSAGPLAEAQVESGPPLLVTAIDRTTLWLCGIALSSSALLAAELLRLRRGPGAPKGAVAEPVAPDPADGEG